MTRRGRKSSEAEAQEPVDIRRRENWQPQAPTPQAQPQYTPPQQYEQPLDSGPTHEQPLSYREAPPYEDSFIYPPVEDEEPAYELGLEDLLEEETAEDSDWYQPQAPPESQAPADPLGTDLASPRRPFGDGMAAPSTNSGFQPELQTRIFQNPFVEGGMPEATQPAAPPEELPRPAEAGQLVVLFACHGGCGATMLATNIATIVAGTGDPACIIDLDLQLGDVLTSLGIESSQVPMSRIVADMESLNWDMVGPLLARHPTGLCALSQVGHIEELSEMDPGRLPHFLRFVQSHFQFLVVDGLRDFSDHALAAMDVADKIVLVTTQEVTSVRGAGIRLQILRRLGYPADKIYLLLNRFNKRSKITVDRVSSALGLTPSFIIPNDFSTVDEALTTGNTLQQTKQGSALALAVDTTARTLFHLPLPPRKKGLLARMMGKK